jgi:hypothetical protein
MSFCITKIPIISLFRGKSESSTPPPPTTTKSFIEPRIYDLAVKNMTNSNYSKWRKKNPRSVMLWKHFFHFELLLFWWRVMMLFRGLSVQQLSFELFLQRGQRGWHFKTASASTCFQARSILCFGQRRIPTIFKSWKNQNKSTCHINYGKCFTTRDHWLKRGWCAPMSQLLLDCNLAYITIH